MSVPYRLLALGALIVLTTAAGPPRLTVLRTIEPGRWTLTSSDNDFAAHAICVSEPRALIELQQPSTGCSRIVIANEARTATIHYTCPGSGHGETTLRVETPRLAQIETQGVTGNGPFEYRIEARRTGPCEAAAR